jgi:hypothetical protein
VAVATSRLVSSRSKRPAVVDKPEGVGEGVGEEGEGGAVRKNLTL